METTKPKEVRGMENPNLHNRYEKARDYTIENNDETKPEKGKLEETKEDHENSEIRKKSREDHVNWKLHNRPNEAKDYTIENNDENKPEKGKLKETKEDHENSKIKKKFREDHVNIKPHAHQRKAKDNTIEDYKEKKNIMEKKKIPKHQGTRRELLKLELPETWTSSTNLKKLKKIPKIPETTSEEKDEEIKDLDTEKDDPTSKKYKKKRIKKKKLKNSLPCNINKRYIMKAGHLSKKEFINQCNMKTMKCKQNRICFVHEGRMNLKKLRNMIKNVDPDHPSWKIGITWTMMTGGFLETLLNFRHIRKEVIKTKKLVDNFNKSRIDLKTYAKEIDQLINMQPSQKHIQKENRKKENQGFLKEIHKEKNNQKYKHPQKQK